VVGSPWGKNSRVRPLQPVRRSGATTLSTRLAAATDCPVVSGGDIFRDLATERDMTLTQLSARAQETDEIDRHLQAVAERWGAANEPFVLQSRLAGRLAGDRADLRTVLAAPEAVRKARIADRDETAAEMAVREVGEAGRYDAYYDVDLEERGFYDLHCNTARSDADGVFEIVRAAVERDEGASRRRRSTSRPDGHRPVSGVIDARRIPTTASPTAAAKAAP
jgi:cytidylate kinase